MNILIIHTAFIGDIVLSTALIEKIAKRYEYSNIYYLTTPLGAQILKNNPNLKEIIVYDKRNKDKGFKGIFKIVKELRKKNIDLCLTPHRYLRSSLLTFFSGAKIKIGYDVAPFSFIFDKKIKYDKTKHEVEKLLSFLDDRIEEDNERFELKLYPSIAEKNKVDLLFKDVQDKKIVVLAPGSKWFTKMWPEEYFNILIDSLSKMEHIKIVIVGGKEEKNINLELTGKVLDLRGETTLLELAEVIRRADIIVSNDSSPIHIGSAFENVKVVGIFGPTIREFGFFPWSKNSTVFEVKDLYCRPCGIHGGNKCPETHFKCMKDIRPQMIENEIKKYLTKNITTEMKF